MAKRYDDQVDRNSLLVALSQASSQHPDTLKLAVATLNEWHLSSGFYPALQEIAYDTSLEFHIRFQAIVYFKNCLDKYWRKSAINGINPSDKNLIRSRLLFGLQETDKKLSIQNSVIISKIARIDYPKDWPVLFDDLVKLIEDTKVSDTLVSKKLQLSTLTTIHLVVKALASKVSASWKTASEKLYPLLGEVITPIYYKNYEELKQLFQETPAEARNTSFDGSVSDRLDFIFMTLKIFRRLMISCKAGFNNVPVFLDFFKNSVHHLREVYSLVLSLSESRQLHEVFTRFLLLIGKIYLELQSVQPLNFVLAEGWLQIMEHSWQLLNEQASRLALQKPCIQAFILFRETVCNYSYMIEKGDSPNNELQMVRDNIETNFLTRDWIIDLLRLLITKYLILRPETDIYQWENDPEEWILEDEADHWQYVLRKGAERLLTSIIFKYKAWIGPILLEILASVMGPKCSLDEILIKDAVYNSIGLAAHDLFDLVDFDGWFQNHLESELSYNGPGYLIIRYRIMWLIGRWVGVKSVKEFRSAYYRTLLHTMCLDSEQPASLIIRWTASISLKKCVDEWEFDPAVFAPYLHASIDQLTSLLTTLCELENKMKIVQVLIVIVERMESLIAPHAEKIALLLPSLWDSAGKEGNLLNASIVALLTKLTKSLGTNSHYLHPLSVPVILQSIDNSGPSFVYLFEDGLELWHTTLHYATCLNELLAQPLPHFSVLITISSESIVKVFEIITSYLLLDADYFVQNGGRGLFEALIQLLRELRSEIVHPVMQLLGTIFQISNSSLYQRDLVESGLFKNLILTASDQAENAYTTVYFLSSLSRLVIKDSSFFVMAFLEVFREESGFVMRKLLSNWVDKLDNMSQLKDQKLTNLAWAYLIATPINHPNFVYVMEPVYECFKEFVAGWTGLLCDVSESDQGDALAYHKESYEDSSDEETPESNRKDKLIESDPVHSIPLKQTVLQKINEAQQVYDNFYSNCGRSERFQIIISSVDPLVLDQLSTN